MSIRAGQARAGELEVARAGRTGARMTVGVEVGRRAEASTATLTGSAAQPDRGGPARWRDPLRTTPARIVVHGLLLAALLVATAVVALRAGGPATTLGERSAATAARTGTSARQIYVGLADADVAASAVFLLPPGADRMAGLKADYQRKIHEVEHALNASMGAAVDDPDRLAKLATIAARLQVYQRIISDALAVAEARGTVASQGVLASAYAREASYYLSTQLLTAAQTLWDYDTRLLREARVDARWWAAASLLMPLLTLAALGAVQWWLWRRTRRRLNAGLLVASAGVAAVLALAVASWSHWPAADSRFPELERAVAEQSATQQRLGTLLAGRADVYLGLGASVDPVGHHEDFDGRKLCDVPDGVDCATLTDVWTARQSQEPDAFRRAMDAVLDAGPAGRSFDAATATLTARLDEGDKVVAGYVDRLPATPRQFGGLAAWVTLLAGAAVVGGLRQRLAEYR
ncbi:hypothetical protein OOK41_25010 [Micromonospora sp. NBC_01655]|uniref:hypothetical protein n=1 Tax=Micromonospora sp. NBC_01655 TaxID=2975983 RepID=UPI0022567D56|nr:hypothetical protein [Micromonospora sp. NBC_01655]MCX4473525.1 hypothetical protein [Micromonospora sp. NBC_01655]